MIQKVFRRNEVKYVLSHDQYEALMERISQYLREDQYFKSTNLSIYFDTPDRYLAIHSLEKPLYKEKLRIRSYGIPTLDDNIFIEIKKKFDGVGSKRRVAIKLKDFYEFLKDHKTLHTDNPQIDAEIQYCFQRYNLEPALLIAYDRLSYANEEDPGFRVTFDWNVRSRTDNLKLEKGDQGDKYFTDDKIVMEVKSLGAYPTWFVSALSSLKIYPQSFSKYGRVTHKLYSNQKGEKYV